MSPLLRIGVVRLHRVPLLGDLVDDHALVGEAEHESRLDPQLELDEGDRLAGEAGDVEADQARLGGDAQVVVRERAEKDGAAVVGVGIDVLDRGVKGNARDIGAGALAEAKRRCLKRIGRGVAGVGVSIPIPIPVPIPVPGRGGRLEPTGDGEGEEGGGDGSYRHRSYRTQALM
jgi:hypothetical protein